MAATALTFRAVRSSFRHHSLPIRRHLHSPCFLTSLASPCSIPSSTAPSRCYHSHAGSSVFDSSIHPDRDVGARIGEVVLTTKFGHDLLLDPLLNKGTSFPMEERERLGIRGLVPPRLPEAKTEAALAKQVKRIMRRYFELSSPIGKYAYMVALQDRNEVLFYQCLILYLEELAPIIYTPTSDTQQRERILCCTLPPLHSHPSSACADDSVGLACQTFSSIFRRPRGMYFSAADKGLMQAMIWNWSHTPHTLPPSTLAPSPHLLTSNPLLTLSPRSPTSPPLLPQAHVRRGDHCGDGRQPHPWSR